MLLFNFEIFFRTTLQKSFRNTYHLPVFFLLLVTAIEKQAEAASFRKTLFIYGIPLIINDLVPFLFSEEVSGIFCLKLVLTNFAKFTRKHLYRGLLISTKLQSFSLQLYLKRDLDPYLQKCL